MYRALGKPVTLKAAYGPKYDAGAARWPWPRHPGAGQKAWLFADEIILE